jgi:pyruvate dehydrogenase E2 component (dihydrolipoamide acetyltransferase)
MPRLLRMPEVAAGATEAVLAEWIVPESAEFAAGGTLATVETDKAMVDVEAEDAGVVLKTLVAPGAHVEVGAPIAVLGQPGEAIGDLDALLAKLGVAEKAPPVPAASAAPPTPPTATTPVSGNGRVYASPLARKIARQSGVAVEAIAGTGPGGRILRRDVEAAIAAQATAPAPAAPAAAGPAAPGEIPHSRLRRAIAARLAQSKQTAPHFYLRATVRAERLAALRAEINAGLADGARVSLNDLVVKAAAAAHQQVPEMNVIWTPEVVRTFPTVDVAVAVATDRGLVTPVLRDVTAQTITQVAARTRDLASRARNGCARRNWRAGRSASPTSGCTASKNSPRSSTRRTPRSSPSGPSATSRWSRTAPSFPARS